MRAPPSRRGGEGNLPVSSSPSMRRTSAIWAGKNRRARKGGRTLRKGVFLPSKHLRLLYDAPF